MALRRAREEAKSRMPFASAEDNSLRTAFFSNRMEALTDRARALSGALRTFRRSESCSTSLRTLVRGAPTRIPPHFFPELSGETGLVSAFDGAGSVARADSRGGRVRLSRQPSRWPSRGHAAAVSDRGGEPLRDRGCSLSG